MNGFQPAGNGGQRVGGARKWVCLVFLWVCVCLCVCVLCVVSVVWVFSVFFCVCLHLSAFFCVFPRFSSFFFVFLRFFCFSAFFCGFLRFSAFFYVFLCYICRPEGHLAALSPSPQPAYSVEHYIDLCLAFFECPFELLSFLNSLSLFPLG